MTLGTDRAELALPSGDYGVIIDPVDYRFSSIGYGPPGLAKTPFFTCLPPWMWGVLYISLDAGADTLNSVFKAHKVTPMVAGATLGKNGLPKGPATNDHPWNLIPVACPDGADMWDWIHRVLTWPGWIDLGIRTLVIDGLSTFAKAMLVAVAQAQFFTKDDKRGKGGAGQQTSVGEKAPLFVPERGDYNAVQNAIVTIRDLALRNRDWHVGFVMHQEMKQIEDSDKTKIVLYGPQTVGQAIMQSFPGEFNQVLHFKRHRGQSRGGKSVTNLLVELEQTGKWPARLRREPGDVSKPHWTLDWNHYRFWEWAANEVGLVCSREPAIEAFATMPVGPFTHPADEAEGDDE